MQNYIISEIAKITGLSVPTLRYYEELGLLSLKRNNSNYRIFTDDDLRWIEFINRAKATGMSLAKIIDYSKLREKGNSTILERMNILAKQEAFLQLELGKIQQHIDFLQNKKLYYTKMLNSPKRKSL